MADDDLDDLVAYVKLRVGERYGLSERQASRLKGRSVKALEADARQMLRELGRDVPDEGDERERGESGRFVSTSEDGDMNALLRKAAGRS